MIRKVFEMPFSIVLQRIFLDWIVPRRKLYWYSSLILAVVDNINQDRMILTRTCFLSISSLKQKFYHGSVSNRDGPLLGVGSSFRAELERPFFPTSAITPICLFSFPKTNENIKACERKLNQNEKSEVSGTIILINTFAIGHRQWRRTCFIPKEAHDSFVASLKHNSDLREAFYIIRIKFSFSFHRKFWQNIKENSDICC